MLPDYVHTTFKLNDTRPWKRQLSGLQKAACSLDDIQAVTWDKVQEATASNPSMLKLLGMFEDGMPEHKSQLPPLLRQYHTFRKELLFTDGVVLYKNRIAISPALRKKILSA